VLSLGTKSFLIFSLTTLIAGVVYASVSTDRMGVTVLFVACGVAFYLGMAAIAGTGPKVLSVSGPEGPLTNRPATPTSAPVLGAVGFGCLVLGSALGSYYFVAGLAILGFAALAWFMTAFKENPAHLPAVSARVGERFAIPFGMPLTVVALIAITAISISRVLLAVSKNGAALIAVLVAVVVLIVASVAAARPRLDRRLVQTLAVIATIAVLAMGAVGLSKGERKFGEHEEKGREVEHKATKVSESGSTETSTDETSTETPVETSVAEGAESK
jgi:uncharacterized membrane protein YhaH (DUF805 family)